MIEGGVATSRFALTLGYLTKEIRLGLFARQRAVEEALWSFPHSPPHHQQRQRGRKAAQGREWFEGQGEMTNCPVALRRSKGRTRISTVRPSAVSHAASRSMVTLSIRPRITFESVG